MPPIHDSAANRPAAHRVAPRAWAKSQDGEPCLTLVDHSVDVAAMMEAILDTPLVRRRVEALAGRPLGCADIARLSFFAGLHDMGKVVHGFQRLLRGGPPASHTSPAAVLLGSGWEPSRVRKEVLKALSWRDWRRWFRSPQAEGLIWDAVLAHHGSLPMNPSPPGRWDWAPRSGYSPIAALVEVSNVLRVMCAKAFTESSGTVPDGTRFLHALAGLVVLADWMGSDAGEFRFPCSGAPTGEARIPWARATARTVLKKRWWRTAAARRTAAGLPDTFASLFPNLGSGPSAVPGTGPPAPRPVQRALLETPLPDAGQIVLLEAETGSGKTEAALVHFLRLFRADQVDGMYFALPTRAAAVQIHRRIARAMKDWFGELGPPVGLAVPGYLRVDDHEGRPLPSSHGVLWADDRTRTRGWSVENSKRYLAGAVMVGTVDQALLGGLRVRHAQLRSAPLMRLLLVVDEVHASDAYMTRLLRNVLDQHRTAGGHALLMSATLGSVARPLLLEPNASPRAVRPAAQYPQHLPYPSLQRSQEPPRPIAASAAPKKVRIELIEEESHVLVTRLRQAAEAGVSVLFIRNRVDDAQDTVRLLEDAGAPLYRCNGVVAPHHGRFAPEDRRLLDAALEQAFAPPRRGLVAVTTQTAEQSLDICADWLITDLAPGDVLLQRIGRLHRHAANARPARYTEPRVTVLAPPEERLEALLAPDGQLRPGRRPLGLGNVYKNLVSLVATRRWLDGHRFIRVPEDNRAFVEAVTARKDLLELATRLEGPWPAHLYTVAMGAAAESTTAAASMLRWDMPLMPNQPLPDGAARSRLGLMDRTFELPGSPKGPFGHRVHRLDIPAWMVPDLPEDAELRQLRVARGSLCFRIGQRRFRYDRLGLRFAGQESPPVRGNCLA